MKPEFLASLRPTTEAAFAAIPPTRQTKPLDIKRVLELIDGMLAHRDA